MFDSTILFDGLCGIAGAGVELARYSRRFISRITWIEIMAGATPDESRQIEDFLNYFSVIELNDEISRRAAVLRADRYRLRLPDAIILASAQVSGRILVTRNTRDFPAAMPGIRVPYTL